MPGPHGIQGIGAGFIPDTLDLKMVDRVEQVGDDESGSKWRAVFPGGRNFSLGDLPAEPQVAAAVRVAREPAMRDKTMVVILPDAGERYLSSALFDGVMD